MAKILNIVFCCVIVENTHEHCKMHRGLLILGFDEEIEYNKIGL